MVLKRRLWLSQRGHLWLSLRTPMVEEGRLWF